MGTTTQLRLNLEDEAIIQRITKGLTPREKKLMARQLAVWSICIGGEEIKILLAAEFWQQSAQLSRLPGDFS